MVMKLLKTQTEDELLIERVMYTKRYSLALDRKKCVGCEICQIVCPREAIEIKKPIKTDDENFLKPTLTLNENECSFCGVCNAICPFGAFSLSINDKKIVPVFEKESFPKLVRKIEVDETKCPIGCDECEEACPFDLIRVSADEKNVEVEIAEENCPGCRLCQLKCPYGAIITNKIISGSIKIQSRKCPDNCHDCVDACPIPGVLKVSEDGRVEVDESCCIYCGVCRVVCPVKDALELQRSSVSHTPVHSGAWNKALEKLTSTKDMAKELHSKLIMKARESVKRRFS